MTKGRAVNQRLNTSRPGMEAWITPASLHAGSSTSFKSCPVYENVCNYFYKQKTIFLHIF